MLSSSSATTDSVRLLKAKGRLRPPKFVSSRPVAGKGYCGPIRCKTLHNGEASHGLRGYTIDKTRQDGQRQDDQLAYGWSVTPWPTT